MQGTRILPFIGLLAGAAGPVACHAPTGPSLVQLEQAQAQWESHHLDRYAYQYRTSGFFNAFDGQAMRLVVIGDTVRSAQFVATNDSVPIEAAQLPTIDELFATAFSASQEGRLSAARFDPAFGFPTELTIAGPPDASGVIAASSIELEP